MLSSGPVQGGPSCWLCCSARQTTPCGHPPLLLVPPQLKSMRRWHGPGRRQPAAQPAPASRCASRSGEVCTAQQCLYEPASCQCRRGMHSACKHLTTVFQTSKLPASDGNMWAERPQRQIATDQPLTAGQRDGHLNRGLCRSKAHVHLSSVRQEEESDSLASASEAPARELSRSKAHPGLLLLQAVLTPSPGGHLGLLHLDLHQHAMSGTAGFQPRLCMPCTCLYRQVVSSRGLHGLSGHRQISQDL